MEIEELVKLALVNHDIDQEKILNNVLKKGRRYVAVKKVMISIGISALLAIPILALSLGLAKSDTTLPPEASITTGTAGAEISVIQSTVSENVTEIFIDNNKIVVGDDDGTIDLDNGFISDALLEAFEKYDSDTKFLVKAYYPNFVSDSFLYKGKTVDEWKSDFYLAKENFDNITKGFKKGSAENAKNEIETANEQYKSAVEAERKYFLNRVMDHLSEKGAEIISSNKDECTVFFISSKEPVFKMASEEKDMKIEFYLGTESNAHNINHTMFE